MAAVARRHLQGGLAVPGAGRRGPRDSGHPHAGKRLDAGGRLGLRRGFPPIGRQARHQGIFIREVDHVGFPSGRIFRLPLGGLLWRSKRIVGKEKRRIMAWNNVFGFHPRPGSVCSGKSAHFSFWCNAFNRIGHAGRVSNWKRDRLRSLLEFLLATNE